MTQELGVSRWAQRGDSFYGVGETRAELPPGLYRCVALEMIGPALTKQRIETDNLLELPDDATASLLAEFHKFWAIGDKFRERGFLHKRGFLLWGPPGCHPRGTRVIMLDGTTKDVAEVRMGDQLMGPDSKPRRVLELISGVGRIYEVRPTKGRPFRVNEDHILALHPSGSAHSMKSRFCMKVKDFLKQPVDFQLRSKLYRTDTIEWGLSAAKPLPIPPYILGIWLGDGHTHEPALTTMDEPMRQAWCGWAEGVGAVVKEHRITSSKATTYSAVSATGWRVAGQNPARNLLRQLGVLDNKHIPISYLTATVDQRLELLAGLIDSDGYRGHEAYDFIAKSRQLAESVVFLARSLGFAAYVKSCEKGCTYLGKRKVGTFWRVSISGDCSRVPVQLERKRSKVRRQIKNPLVTGFTLHEVEPGRYFGFSLSGDHLYLLDDFTVTHNSGKTCSLMLMAKRLVLDQEGVVVILDQPQVAAACLQMARKIEPKRPMIAIMEDLDALVQKYGENEYLALLDGEAQVDNICMLGTTNYPENLDPRFTDRPSRFDTIRYVGMPSAAARRLYLSTKEPSLEGDELETWVEASDGFSVAHLKEMIVAVKCFDQPLEVAVKRLSAMRERRPNSEDSPERRRMGILGGAQLGNGQYA